MIWIEETNNFFYYPDRIPSRKFRFLLKKERTFERKNINWCKYCWTEKNFCWSKSSEGGGGGGGGGGTCTKTNLFFLIWIFFYNDGFVLYFCTVTGLSKKLSNEVRLVKTMHTESKDLQIIMHFSSCRI